MTQRTRAAHIITRFLRRVEWCWLTHAPVPFARAFFTTPDVCCDMRALVKHFVRMSCADEASLVTPRCPVRKAAVMGAPALLVLCRRCLDAQHWDQVVAMLDDCPADNPLRMQAFGMSRVDHIIRTFETDAQAIAAIFLFRLGFEALKHCVSPPPASAKFPVA